MELQQRIDGFLNLGSYLRTQTNGTVTDNGLNEAILKSTIENPWFREEDILFSLKEWARVLNEMNLKSWLGNYHDLTKTGNPLSIGLVMAGNIPMAGLHDVMCVLLTGNKAIVKLSHQDKRLIPYLTDKLAEFVPEFQGLVIYTDRLSEFDAVIATGSNNTARYFEYYFGKHPHIIRKNRFSAAVISNDTTDKELAELGKDVFTYFGKGCRNVSRLFIPEGYDLPRIMQALDLYPKVFEHHKYANNYHYYRTIFLINQETFLDNGFVILKEDKNLSAPMSTLFFEYYTSEKNLKKRLDEIKEEIQCIVGSTEPYVPFGKAQQPSLSDYADNVDVLEFLLSLKNPAGKN